MPFGISPEIYVPPGTPVEPPNTTAFTVDPAPQPSALTVTPAQFLQWMTGGYSLGDPDVTVVDFIYPLVATRGVGEKANVITVKRATPPGINDAMSPIPVPLIIDGELITPPSLFYTSILYPFFFTDGITAGISIPESGYTLQVIFDAVDLATPALESGTLIPVIAFITYDARPWPDTAEVSVPVLESGTLIVVIAFITYDARPWPDTAQPAIPVLSSGTLVVTITYVTYDNSLAHPDTMQSFVPTLQTGTLT